MTFDDASIRVITGGGSGHAASRPGAALLDSLLVRTRLKNDARLARALGVSPPVISKIRSGKLRVSDGFILRVHETFDLPVREIRAILASS